MTPSNHSLRTLGAARLAGLLLCATLAGFLMAGCATSSRVAEGDRYFREANYANALDSYRAAAESDGPSEELDRRIENALVRLAMEEGSWKLFEGDAEEALGIFRWVEGQRPDDPLVQEWINKSRWEVSGQHVLVARAHAQDQEFKEALAELEIAERFWPGHVEVNAVRVQVEAARRALLQKAADYHSQGNRAWTENRPLQAMSSFAMALDFDPDHVNARHRLDQVREEYSYHAMKTAREFVDSGKWNAAVGAIKQVLDYNADFPGAQELLEDMESEAEAQDLLEDALRYTARDDYREARRAIARGRLLSSRQDEAFDEQEREVSSKELVSHYLGALRFFHEGAYDKALARYQGVVEEIEASEPLLEAAWDLPRNWEEVINQDYDPSEFLRHPKVWWTYRRCQNSAATLEVELRVAAKFYEDARVLEDEGKLVEARVIFRDIRISLPNYLDVFDRLAAIERTLSEQELAEPKTGDAGTAGDPGKESGLE